MSHKPLFIDVHILQTVPPSCINRDDTGSPKTAMFGGVRRARVSSQAWKRAVRHEFESLLDIDKLGIRTKHAVELIADSIKEKDQSVTDLDAIKMAKDIVTAGLKANKKADGESLKYEKDGVRQKTLVFIGRNEIDRLAEVALDGSLKKQEKEKKAKETFLPGASRLMTAVDIALFGRMVATDPDLNIDAAVQVAHALGVGKSELEFDYYTAQDDFDFSRAAAMIGTVEYLSATFYRYATVDVYHLCENLGSIKATIKAIEAFLRAFVTSMPTGKQNTFANRTLPAAVVVQIRNTQPVSLVGAFEKPVYATEDHSVTELACKRLADQTNAIDEAFGTSPIKTFVMCGAPAVRECLDGLEGDDVSLDGVAAGTALQVEQYLSSCGFALED